MTTPRFVATMGGIGLMRPAPGTWGSALVLPLVLLGPIPCLLIAAALTLAGTWAVGRLLATDRGADPGWVVVDEGAGQLLALAALSTEPTGWGVILAFLLFRLFDVYKPGPVGWADRQHGAFGVMLDDIVAGAIVAGLILLLRLTWPELPL
ncbi:phosphatidylglycerophosphatase A family protein [Belnapia rosea]|uniref:Phosphatidylglycerophosphatase A n=1 Tax=Belnapia rosea TaxID=938405 RepID=A0A1G6K6X2_9PROT|nr:phosphatidylglycerophosphatase A [Belnapia rosea]SDB16795.1 phosphatidylglycerophosphatase A [Belnapia rosea]SDC26628.1 phosphatidylglycerophosphatase [Belnapia rosea]